MRCLVLQKPARSKCTWTFHKSYVEICKKSAVCQSRDTRFVRACAVEMRTDISQEPFCLDLFCASLRSRNAHGRFTRAILCGNLQEKCLTPSPRHIRFVRACAVEMHMDMSQEAFCREIYRKNAKRFRYHLD